MIKTVLAKFAPIVAAALFLFATPCLRLPSSSSSRRVIA